MVYNGLIEGKYVNLRSVEEKDAEFTLSLSMMLLSVLFPLNHVPTLLHCISAYTRLLQPLNTSVPTDVTLEGIVIATKFVHPSNALFERCTTGRHVAWPMPRTMRARPMRCC